jgi:hypothetical protein
MIRTLDLEFPEKLRRLVSKIGVRASARICDVDPRTVHLWLKGQGNPSRATREGALKLLGDSLARGK